MAKPLGAIALAVCPPQQRYPESLARLGRIPTSAPLAVRSESLHALPFSARADSLITGRQDRTMPA